MIGSLNDNRSKFLVFIYNIELLAFRFYHIRHSSYPLDVALRLLLMDEMSRDFVDQVYLLFLYKCWLVGVVFRLLVIKVDEFDVLSSDTLLEWVNNGLTPYNDSFLLCVYSLLDLN